MVTRAARPHCDPGPADDLDPQPPLPARLDREGVGQYDRTRPPQSHDHVPQPGRRLPQVEGRLDDGTAGDAAVLAHDIRLAPRHQPHGSRLLGESCPVDLRAHGPGVPASRGQDALDASNGRDRGAEDQRGDRPIVGDIDVEPVPGAGDQEWCDVVPEEHELGMVVAVLGVAADPGAVEVDTVDRVIYGIGKLQGCRNDPRIGEIERDGVQRGDRRLLGGCADPLRRGVGG